MPDLSLPGDSKIRRWLTSVLRAAALPALLSLVALAGMQPRAAQADASVADEINCLALNLYFEARGEPKLGAIAVAHVVMNRVSHRKFPARVCDVIRQGGERPFHRCQFSWWCDGRSDKPLDEDSWERSKALAHLVYWGLTKDPTSGSLWYHADYVSPIWRHALERAGKIGAHIFYRPNPSDKLWALQGQRVSALATP